MNLLFFLKPKQDVCVLKTDYTVRQSIEKLRAFNYTAVPVIDSAGLYCGTISEGDLLKVIVDKGGLYECEKVPLNSLINRKRNPAVNISVGLEELLHSASEQNFVPVVDDGGIFIGIVTRKDIILHFIKRLGQQA